MMARTVNTALIASSATPLSEGGIIVTIDKGAVGTELAPGVLSFLLSGEPGEWRARRTEICCQSYRLTALNLAHWSRQKMVYGQLKRGRQSTCSSPCTRGFK